MQWLFQLVGFLASLISGIVDASKTFSKLVAQCVGAINSVGVSWNSVSIVGPIIGALIMATVAFIVIDFVRDVL